MRVDKVTRHLSLLDKYGSELSERVSGREWTVAPNVEQKTVNCVTQTVSDTIVKILLKCFNK